MKFCDLFFIKWKVSDAHPRSGHHGNGRVSILLRGLIKNF